MVLSIQVVVNIFVIQLINVQVVDLRKLTRIMNVQIVVAVLKTGIWLIKDYIIVLKDKMIHNVVTLRNIQQLVMVLHKQFINKDIIANVYVYFNVILHHTYIILQHNMVILVFIVIHNVKTKKYIANQLMMMKENVFSNVQQISYSY